MNKNIIMLSLAFATLLIVSNPVEAKNESTVKLEVIGNNDDILTARSFLLRELRSIHDLTVVDENPDFTLKVEIVQVRLGNRLEGYVVFGVILYYDGTSYNNFLSSASFQTRPENLRRTYENLVAGFDQVALEPLR